MAPSNVGLVVTPRRKAPGLRREAVAQLAGISASWYAGLEQKRAIGISPRRLDNLLPSTTPREQPKSREVGFVPAIFSGQFAVMGLIYLLDPGPFAFDHDEPLGRPRTRSPMMLC